MTSNHACALNLAPNPAVISVARLIQMRPTNMWGRRCRTYSSMGRQPHSPFSLLTLISEKSSPDRFQPPFSQLASCKPMIAAELQSRPVRFSLLLMTYAFLVDGQSSTGVKCVESPVCSVWFLCDFAVEEVWSLCDLIMSPGESIPPDRFQRVASCMSTSSDLSMHLIPVCWISLSARQP